MTRLLRMFIRPVAWRVTAAICLLGSLAVLSPAPVSAQQFGGDTTDTPVERLQPRTPRSERDEDELYAATQYAHGRMLLQRDDPAGALRRFQRAYRYNPAATIARDVLAIASSLNRHAEAARYAILAAERKAENPDLVRQLGEILVEQGEYQRAAAMFERALELMKQSAAPLPGVVLLQAEVGRIYLVLEKYDRAAEMLAPIRRALEQPEQFGFAGEAKEKLLSARARLLPLVGESLLRTGDFDGAEKCFQSVHEAQPDAPLLAFQLARIAAQRHDVARAREQLQRYFTANSSVAGSQPYELLGQVIAEELQDSGKATAQLLKELATLHRQQADNVPLGYFLAERLLEAGETQRGATLLEELMEREPKPAAYRELARIYHQRQDADAMLRLYGRAFGGKAVVDLLDEDGRKIAQDASFFTRLINRLRAEPAESGQKQGGGSAPGYGRYLGAALLAIGAGEPEIVEELYDRALDRGGTAKETIHETLGFALLRSEQYSLAAKVFARAIADKPSAAKAAAYHYYRAAALEFAGDTAGALEAVQKCVELSPDSLPFQIRSAWVLYHAQRWQDAEQRYLALLAKYDGKFDNNEIRDQTRQARLALSNICVMQNRLPEAEEWLEQVLDEFPEDVGAHNDLGYLWADQGKHLQRALQMCQKAVDSEPGNGAYRDSLGWAFFRLNRFAEAVKELEEAARLTPDGVIFDHLGDAYLAARHTEKAVEAWQRAVDAFEQEKEVDKRKQSQAKIQQYRSP